MNIDVAEIITIVANIGVLAGIIFLALELRQNNRFLAAQARLALRQFRNDMADSLIQPAVTEAIFKHHHGDGVTDSERGIALGVAAKALEVWEWQYGEYRAGMLQLSEVPFGAWRLWYHGKGPVPIPAREMYQARRAIMNPDFVRFFDENVVAQPPAPQGPEHQ
jgi:hypothetical protein